MPNPSSCLFCAVSLQFQHWNPSTNLYSIYGVSSTHASLGISADVHIALARSGQNDTVLRHTQHKMYLPGSRGSTFGYKLANLGHDHQIEHVFHLEYVRDDFGRCKPTRNRLEYSIFDQFADRLDSSFLPSSCCKRDDLYAYGLAPCVIRHATALDFVETRLARSSLYFVAVKALHQYGMFRLGSFNPRFVHFALPQAT